MKVYNSTTGKVRTKRPRIEPTETKIQKLRRQLSKWENIAVDIRLTQNFA